MEGAATTLASNVGQLLGEEFQLLRGVGGEVAELRDELETMNALLCMQFEAEDGGADLFVRVWMKQVRELAYDAEDLVHLYILRIKYREDGGFLVSCRRLLATLFSRHSLAGDIQALRDRAVAISERHARYGVNREALQRAPYLAPAMAVGASALRHAANDPDQFVGIMDQATALATKVDKVNEGDLKPNVFSIVGFGGLGKTTLAMEVCRQLEVQLQRQAQVTVSQTFNGKSDLQELLRGVIRQIVKPTGDKNNINEVDSTGSIDGMDVAQLSSRLKELLDKNRYLIVIDDVWTVAAWDAIYASLPHNNCNSRIIVTTRIQTVAKACSGCNTRVRDDYIYQIQPLNDEDSKKLFLSRAFGSKDDDSCPGVLKEEMVQILKKCGGLPLAIVSIGSLLAGYSSPECKSMWERVRTALGSYIESHPTLERMRHILTLSYNHLSYNLKCCMMYLSIFPEDYVIEKYRLLNRWISEGLVAAQRGLTLMEVAEGYYDELMSRGMINRAYYEGRYTSRSVEACRVHDLMLEVMVSKSLEANFVSLVGGQYQGMSYDRIRRLSIHGMEEESEDTLPKKRAAPRGKRIPSLSILGMKEVSEDTLPKKRAAPRGKRNGIKGMNVLHVRSVSSFKQHGHMLLDRLGELNLVRVLDLEDCKDIKNKHMRYICRMHLLRFLSLKGTEISVMPPRVGKLEHLETLDVRDTGLTELPEDVTKLEKLENLLFFNNIHWQSGWRLPRGLGRMKALCKVNQAIVTDDIDAAKEIGELENLREFFIYYDSKKKMGQEVLEAFAISLGKAHSLRWLEIGDFGYQEEAMNFLHLIPSTPWHLEYLMIRGGIDRLPDWVGLLPSLVEFSMGFSFLDGDKLFCVLCKLPNLKIITVEARCYVGEELVARATQKFPMIRELRLYSWDGDDARMYRFEEGSMTTLEMLSVRFVDIEREISGIQYLTSLKEVRVFGKRDNTSLTNTLEQLKDENTRRPESSQFKILATFI